MVSNLRLFHYLKCFVSLIAIVLTVIPWVSAKADGDSVVVFNEIQYHPKNNDAALQWVELHNQMGVDVDLSSWRIQEGID